MRDTQIWIGLTDKQDEGKFVWQSGRPFSLVSKPSAWLRGQPYDFEGGQDCVVVDVSPNELGMNDVECYEVSTFMCQKRLETGSHFA